MRHLDSLSYWCSLLCAQFLILYECRMLLQIEDCKLVLIFQPSCIVHFRAAGADCTQTTQGAASHLGRMTGEPDKGPISYEEPDPISPRDQPRVSSIIHTPVAGEADIPGPAAASHGAPAFITKLVALDRHYSKWVHENCLTDFTYICLRFFEFSGDGFFWLPVAIAFWLSPSVGSPGTRLFALNLFVCLLFDLLVVGSIKSAVRRKRPHYNRGHFVVVSVDSWSFPSGHSTRAVMIVTLIWLYSPLWRTMITSYWYPNLVLNYKENYFMAHYVLPYVENHLLTIAYFVLTSWMLATACSRVVLGRHYISDVVGGIIIGVLEALVAHFCLHVPLKVSELQHAYLLARFGLDEEFFWRFFPGGWFSTKHHFGDVNQAEQGIR
ncbi:hypothetical protein KC19_11G103100 [Ceratodon purpureus]|uniref:Phosphatidic acid phosphatase type 2/haloperoxidase domain-containing protein n=2 Tax=Ceratodon purpureus TaxID=3225 RepID=A0A8T0GDK7_CERPU|nr:hypothetical protein KC19_11G103100 [Ceratodon purpureus]